MTESTTDLVRMLERSRVREKRQTLFYRRLAAEAAEGDRSPEVERLNELHADEQHHLSRLTARVLELGGEPGDLREVKIPDPSLDGWEETARAREREEVRWYEEILDDGPLDDETRRVLAEILESERHHRDVLGGKWMTA